MRGSPITSGIDYAVAVKKENSMHLIFARKATRENILTAKVTQTTVIAFRRFPKIKIAAPNQCISVDTVISSL